MAMRGLLGEKKDQARLKLLLSDRAKQGSFCLTFNYRVTGKQVGSLRVLLNNNAYPVWEQSRSQDQDWQTELLTVAWKNQAPESVSYHSIQTSRVIKDTYRMLTMSADNGTVLSESIQTPSYVTAIF